MTDSLQEQLDRFLDKPLTWVRLDEFQEQFLDQIEEETHNEEEKHS